MCFRFFIPAPKRRGNLGEGFLKYTRVQWINHFSVFVTDLLVLRVRFSPLPLIINYKQNNYEKEYKYVLKFVDNILNNCGNKKDYEHSKRCYDWLKSLRPQPKQEWSEEDQNALEDIREAVVHYWGGDSQDILLYWLKSLKEKIKKEAV